MERSSPTWSNSIQRKMPWKHQSDVRLSCSGLVEALCVCSAAGRASLRDHNEAKEHSPSELPVLQPPDLS